MFNKIILFSFILQVFFLNACSIISTSPDVLVRNELTGDGVAVLDFTQQSTSMVSNMGKFAADKLTDALFLERQFKVIDRAVVKDAIISMDINNTDLLSLEDIKKLGNLINANFIILGRIQYFTEPEFLNSNSDKELYISFRILSVSSGDIVGIANSKRNFSENIIDELSYVINDLVRSI